MPVLWSRLWLQIQMNSINNVALNGNCNEDEVNVNENNPNNHNDNRAWRGSLRAYELCTAFNQPPGILPMANLRENLDYYILLAISSQTSTVRVEYPHSLSYQEKILTMFFSITMVERPSMIEERGSFL